MTFDLADLTALDLLDAELVGCVGADYGDNMVAAFQAQASAAAPAAASPLPGALAAGTRDESVLTDLEFSARHPERGGKKIGPDDTALAKEWLRIRQDVVRPALARATPASPASATLVVPGPAAAPAPLPGSNAAVAEKVAEGTKRNQQIALGLGALALLGLGTAIITR